MWKYRAVVLSVHDGDTFTVDADEGFDNHTRLKIRLIGINAPELGARDANVAEAALASRDILTELLGLGTWVYIKTQRVRDDSHEITTLERYVAWVWTTQEPMEDDRYSESVNVRMVQMGYATKYMAPKEWPADVGS